MTMLESIDLTKKYGAKTAVDGVSIRLEPGHIYAMLGPNGSGKTTWMKMAAGLVKPTSGKILFDGRPVGVESRRDIAYMSTEPYFYSWMTVRDVGKYYGDFFPDYSPDRYAALLKEMDLTEDLKTRTLSSGMPHSLRFSPAHCTMPFAASTCVTKAPSFAQAQVAPPVYPNRLSTFMPGLLRIRERIQSQLTACSGNSPVCLKPVGRTRKLRSL